MENRERRRRRGGREGDGRGGKRGRGRTERERRGKRNDHGTIATKRLFSFKKTA